MRLAYNISLLSFSLSRPSRMPLPTCFQMQMLCFHCYCMHFHTPAYTHIPEYIPLNQHLVICIYVFKAGRLALDNKLLCFSLGQATSPPLRFPQLSVVLSVRLMPRAAVPVHCRCPCQHYHPCLAHV